MRKINFGSGPAALPQEVLEEASEAILDYEGSGLSILEIPHRGKLFDAILEESKALVNELCELNNEYEILWLQGGRLQFDMIPMNFLASENTAAYFDSGHWAAEAAEAATHYGHVNILASSKENNYNRLPDIPSFIPGNLSYLYLTTNNTIYGTQWKSLPNTKAPLIADMSSDILSRKFNYSSCAMFFAVAQKNIGPAGVTLVAIHKDFLKKQVRTLSPMLDYVQHARQHSVLNTPPVFAIYTSLLTLRWINKRSLHVISKENHAKAQVLYEEIDHNPFFTATVVNRLHRSDMNICFLAKDKQTEMGFSKLCEENGVTGIAGHRSVGGFRASLYNAISLADVGKLVSLMQQYGASSS